MLAAIAGTPIEAGVLRPGSDQWKIKVEGPAHAGGGHARAFTPARFTPHALAPSARTPARSRTRRSLATTR